MEPKINPDAPGFNPGAHPSRPDIRDHQWSEIGANSAPFDWTAGYDIEVVIGQKIPPKNQGASSSCGGQAWASEAAAVQAAITKVFAERSAKYVYAQTYVPGGGSGGRENAIIFKNQGVAHETALPSYDNGQPPSEAFMERSQDITDAIRQDAKTDVSLSYANVALDIDSLAQAMRDNHGVIIGICGSNNGTWLSQFPATPKSGEAIWRHWLYAGKAKMINGKKYIGFLNSWGSNVGDHGWQWIPSDYISTIVHDVANNVSQQAVWESWTHVYNPNPVPVGFTHNFAVDIKYGDNSSEVVALQKALQIDGEFPSTTPTTGSFGNITRRAVLAFQVKYQVASVAELNSLQGKQVGVKTRAKLNSLFNH